MGQHSSGGNFLLRLSGEAWLPLEEAYLVEASTYEWKYVMTGLEPPPLIRFCGLPQAPHRLEAHEAYGQLITPFYSGQVTFEINAELFESYIYPDPRKLTQEQYNLMLSEILQEAPLCFNYSEIETGIQADRHSRLLSLAQWSYLQASFAWLASLIRQVVAQPTRVLQAREQQMRRDRVKTVDSQTMGWLERNRRRSASGTVPEIMRSSIREDSYNTYENRVIKRSLVELRHLLKLYGKASPGESATTAELYADKVGYWLREPFFKQVTPYGGAIRISQVFRKHPVYQQCYQWFERLYKHGDERIGLQYSYPLKETFALYEIWCYMQLVKVFREKGMLKNSSRLFQTTHEGLFLHFAENKESVVHLTNGMRIYYQRVYQYNSPHFYTFTQMMKPDIVIETGDHLYVLDPKYRVPANLGTALGEMHKYRDGILLRRNDERAVQNVFILTPVQSDELRYFAADFQDRYKMGAIGLTPGGDMSSLRDWVDKLVAQEERMMEISED
ncbi:DUF2357 domain-containing protein [Paenibacillus agricola]|uniref:DUF2357 domain-containing protein n=1 Tax=Paenibacillus agricola TaxID=2716264 RepID=A0ABX0JD99_9BACL|nr:DUF2357 domain-containing protein [Paenibacillus agricola]NHN34409.1 DUF2357 domain-containing protein [Paenibacillus agricola]